VALVWTYGSEERIAIIRAKRISDLGTTLAVTSLTMEVIRSSETSLLPRATQRGIPEDGILHNHRRENLISYIPASVLSLMASTTADWRRTCSAIELLESHLRFVGDLSVDDRGLIDRITTEMGFKRR
jgi:hypothetical protein